jgi:hypothetical protein
MNSEKLSNKFLATLMLNPAPNPKTGAWGSGVGFHESFSDFHPQHLVVHLPARL